MINIIKTKDNEILLKVFKEKKFIRYILDCKLYLDNTYITTNKLIIDSNNFWLKDIKEK